MGPFYFGGSGSVWVSFRSALTGRHLPELLSAFASDALITVVYGRDEIGRVHPLSFVDTGKRPLLLLGGRTWQLQHIDWPAGIAHAVPAQGHGITRWLGNAMLLFAAISGEIRQLLSAGNRA